MKIENHKVIFSKEDQAGLVIKSYLSEEVTDKRNKYKRNRNVRRMIFALILLVLVGTSYIFVQLQYACYIALAFMIFLVIVYEMVDRINIKALSRKNYFEVKIDKILPTESHVAGTLTPGSDVTVYYPVEAHDTTSGYKGQFYLQKEQYVNASVGDVIKISIKGEAL